MLALLGAAHVLLAVSGKLGHLTAGELSQDSNGWGRGSEGWAAVTARMTAASSLFDVHGQVTLDGSLGHKRTHNACQDLPCPDHPPIVHIGLPDTGCLLYKLTKHLKDGVS